MPSEHDEFDLDVRLHGIPVTLWSQEETREEACNSLRSFCECDDTSAETCDGLAVTCNTCHQTCGGEGGTFCEDTCGGPDLTCRTCECQTLVGCPTHGCNTVETCDQKLCAEGETELGSECESDGCGGDPGGPDEGPVDDLETIQGMTCPCTPP